MYRAGSNWYATAMSAGEKNGGKDKIRGCQKFSQSKL